MNNSSEPKCDWCEHARSEKGRYVCDLAKQQQRPSGAGIVPTLITGYFLRYLGYTPSPSWCPVRKEK